MVSDLARTAAAADVVGILKQTGGVTVLVNYLPVGSQKATEFYAAEGVSAGRHRDGELYSGFSSPATRTGWVGGAV